jgi:hypothetical protein
VRRYCRTDDGVSILEYVLLVALVAMIAAGALLYLGQGSASPGHVVNNVGNNVGVNNNVLQVGPGVAVGGGSSGAPGQAWCTSGQTDCTDPMAMNGQTEVIHFWASGGTPPYSYTLQGQQPFMTLDPSAREITVAPTDCLQDLGEYSLALIVQDSATPTPNTGRLDFIVQVDAGSLCSG